ncbi:major facilitator superfamily domain-containing protein [Talaromyces proteolyticus]|uniref:Major facilitator superfamily domain-containing protein n=1 Tax=Talaromyces proteolyticus TaxID=1131652 RepID=A0AAD4KEF2_9EURO|nr:major facilitator superfamily domain-containing protein [Talaromyces proteolyticus]KAH8690018.1 major facilitator superfamily domain-containing protein [Talaromyces proteolyticus]
MATKDASTTVTSTISPSHSSASTTDLETSSFHTPAKSSLEKTVLRKIDFWLVGFYSFVYIFRVIDSGNYSNAAIINLEQGTGIKKELHLSPSQWAWTLSIFSYSYLIFEPSNTVLLKKFRPSRWMFVLIFAWGVCACSVGAAQDFKGLMCVRFAIGMAEAGFYPSVLYHMAFWYKPAEMPWRIALFYSLGQVSSALSGLLAYAISFMDGVGGLAGWRWLFILEGIPALILAFVALFWLPDYPESAKMLTEDERVYVTGRLAGTAAPLGKGKSKQWDWTAFKILLYSPTVYTFAVYWIGHGIGGFGVSYALPTVIYELGFTTTAKSQLMNIPPYVACFFFLNTVGYMIHRKWIRPWTTAIAIEATTIICYIILITVHNSTVKYLALIVSTSCAGSAYPVIWPERIRALENPKNSKYRNADGSSIDRNSYTIAAGIGIGFTNAMAQFSGIVGPHVYSTAFGPTYRVSYVICLAFLVVSILAILVSWTLIWRGDRREDRDEDEPI